MTVRRHDFEGSFNFRDLGGWRTDDGASVKWGKLFRADSVHLMTDADVIRARDQLRIRTVVDLRNDEEIAIGGIGTLAEAAERHHAPLSSRRGLDPIDAAAGRRRTSRSQTARRDTSPPGYLLTLERSADLIVDIVERFASARRASRRVLLRGGQGPDGRDERGRPRLPSASGTRTSSRTTSSRPTRSRPIIGRFASTPGSPDMYRDLPPSHFAPYAETMEMVVAGVKER